MSVTDPCRKRDKRRASDRGAPRLALGPCSRGSCASADGSSRPSGTARRARSDCESRPEDRRRDRPRRLGVGRRLLPDGGRRATTASSCSTPSRRSLARTTLGDLGEGADVNLEPALRAGEPLGGHYVQGHVDGVGRVRSVEPEGDGRRLALDVPAELLRYCVEKGSLAVDGVSLTIAAITGDGVEIALVPHTLRETTLADLEPGDGVNLEVDVLAKYVERLTAR